MPRKPTPKRAPKTKRPRCSAKTVKGRPCKRSALPGTDPALCVSHVGGKVGRKPTLTHEVSEKIIGLLSAGNYVETAVGAAGVGRATFYEWLERGDPQGTKAEDQAYREFRERVEHARAEGEARAVLRISTSKDWRAAAWFLERQFPDRWGRTSQSGGGGAPVVGDGAPHHEGSEPDEVGGATVTALSEIRQRAASKT